MNTQLLIQLLVNGLVVGTLYGVVAMSFVLIYKATQVVNFAQGELLLVGDNWENDYLAAGSAGWQAVHLARDTRAACVPPFANPSPASIRSLAELS